MRMLVHAKLPHEPFNAAVKNGTVGKTIDTIWRKPGRRRCFSQSMKAGEAS